MTADQEFLAIRRCSKIIEQFTTREQLRILAYLSDRAADMEKPSSTLSGISKPMPSPLNSDLPAN